MNRPVDLCRFFSHPSKVSRARFGPSVLGSILNKRVLGRFPVGKRDVGSVAMSDAIHGYGMIQTSYALWHLGDCVCVCVFF